MTQPLISANYKASYQNSLANNADRKKQNREGFVVPEIKENNAADNFQKKDKKTNWGYISGVVSTVAQLAAGLLMIPAALMERKTNNLTESKIKKLSENLSEKKKKEEIEKIIGEFGESSIERLGKWLTEKGKYKTFAKKLLENGQNIHIKGKNANKLGWISLGFSYLVSIPSIVGASFSVKQPSMLLGSILWAAATPFMMMEKYEGSSRLKGFLLLGYAFNYIGLANKIKNDEALKTSGKTLEYDIKGSKDSLSKKISQIVKFSLKDHLSLPESVKNACVQTKEYVLRQRKEVPDFMSLSPTSDNRKITSILLYAGGIPLMIFGKKNKIVEKAANLMIGSGLFLDAIGMLAIGRKEKGGTKALLLGGVPLRTVGDFAQTNKLMYGVRTLGGASFEYYFAALNKKEEAEKTKTDSKV
ncbi:MAG: hypothetical protein WCG23_02425 [bacterium]